MNNNSSLQINNILNTNKLINLKLILKKKRYLSNCNYVFVYLFFIFQIIGILSITISNIYNNTYILCIGVSLIILAMAIYIFEKINNIKLKIIMRDIKLIKNDIYVNEDENLDKDIEENIFIKQKILSLCHNNNDIKIDNSLNSNQITDDSINVTYKTDESVNSEQIINDSINFNEKIESNKDINKFTTRTSIHDELELEFSNSDNPIITIKFD